MLIKQLAFDLHMWPVDKKQDAKILALRGMRCITLYQTGNCDLKMSS